MVQWSGLQASTAGGMALVPWWGTKILQAMRCNKTKDREKTDSFEKSLDHNFFSENIPATRFLVAQHLCHNWLDFLLK